MKKKSRKKNCLDLFLLINMFLLLTITLTSCSSPQKNKSKPLAILRVYLEADYNEPGRTEVVPVYRANPTPVRIYKNPILDESHIVQARIVDTVGGIALQIQYNFHGTLVLQQVSNAYRGRRIVIFTAFPEARWLTAIRMNRPIMDGILTFTPDATPEEAQRIVTGLNNMAKKLRTSLE